MMDTLLTRLSSMLLGEPTPETADERVLRLRNHAKQQLLAKSQRAVILEDLERAVQTLRLYLQTNRSGTDRTNPTMSEPLAANAALMESTDDCKQLLLTDELAVVNALCTHLDRCMTHGLRAVESSDDNGATVQFFGVVKWTCSRVDAMRQRHLLGAMQAATISSKRVAQVVTTSVAPDLPRDIRGFVGAVRAAASLANVTSDEGKARAFVRQALNMHVLQPAMALVLAESNVDLLASYYTEFALFRQRDDARIFLGLLAGLDALAFAFAIDDPRLDAAPDALPFAKPRPRPTAQKSCKTAPALIDPEDMVSGRVRLCAEDDGETRVLAAKLVSHHELRSTFDSTKGGNPLSDVLRQAADAQPLEDAATAVLRFLELGYPEYDVFGTALDDALCNPFLSGMARFEPAMALPDVVEACLCYLYEHVDTPGLFQVHLHADHVLELRDTIEELGGFHKRMTVDPHEVTAILLQYLWELPDALLTDERLENFLACGASGAGSMTDDEKRMLLRVLVNDLPWQAKPILERLCHFVMVALEPCHAARNGLTMFAVAHALAPILLRRKHSVAFHEFEDATLRQYPVGYQTSSSVRARLLRDSDGDDDAYGTAAERAAADARVLRHLKRDAEESAHVLRLLFSEHAFVLRDFRDELVGRRAALREKVFRLETIRFKMEAPIELTNATHIALLHRLWLCLLPAPAPECVIDERTGAVDVSALLASERWRRSGFHTADPLGGFRGGGVLSLETLVFFGETYPEKARAMMTRNAAPGGSRYPFPVASINVMRMLMKLLMLDEAPDICSKLVLHAPDDRTPTTVLKLRIAERVSRTPFWRVLDDAQAFAKLHAMAFMLLDLHWIHSGATQMGFQPVLDATRRQMGWLLEQAPASVDAMWTKWIEVREQHAAKFTPVFASGAATLSGTTPESDDLVEQMLLHLRERNSRSRDTATPVGHNDSSAVVAPEHIAIDHVTQQSAADNTAAATSNHKDDQAVGPNSSSSDANAIASVPVVQSELAQAY